MKIAFVTISSPYGLRETYITNELKTIAKIKKDFLVFPIFPTDKKKFDARLSNFIYQQTISDLVDSTAYAGKNLLKILKILFLIARDNKPKRFLYSVIFLPKSILLASLVKKLKIDHLHAYWGSSPATCCFIVNQLEGIGFSFTIHRADIIKDNMIERKAQFAKFVRSISQKGKERAIALGADRKKIFVSHLGVDTPKYSHPKEKEETLELVNVGDLISLKGTLKLVETISALNEVRLTIYGEGPLRKKLQNKIKGLDLDSRVKLAGRINHSELIKLYKRKKFDLFVLPSSIEGIPVSAMEAMAHSIPVAIRMVGAVDELVDSKNGYPLDESLVNLKQICKKLPESSKLTLAYKKIAREFNIKLTTKQFLKLLDEKG